MNKLLANIKNVVFYIEDVLIYSKTEGEYIETIIQVLKRHVINRQQKYLKSNNFFQQTNIIKILQILSINENN